MVLPIPILTQAIATTITNTEWQTHGDDVNAWITQTTLDIHALDNTIQIKAAPVIYTTVNPTTNTGRLGCMAQMQAWMYRVCQQEQDALHAANPAQQVAAAVAAAQATTVQAPPPPPPPPVWQGGPPAGPQPQFYQALLQQHGG